MLRANTPSITNPRCETDEYAMSFFMSFWTRVTIAPYTMPTIARNTIVEITHGVLTASGNMGSENRTKPYVPIFRRTAARMTDPAVGASVWASGSQVWNGNMGTLIAKPKKNAKKSQTWSSAGMPAATAVSFSIENVAAWPRPL